jgi:hypothetical protein
MFTRSQSSGRKTQHFPLRPCPVFSCDLRDSCNVCEVRDVYFSNFSLFSIILRNILDSDPGPRQLVSNSIQINVGWLRQPFPSGDKRSRLPPSYYVL